MKYTTISNLHEKVENDQLHRILIIGESILAEAS